MEIIKKLQSSFKNTLHIPHNKWQIYSFQRLIEHIYSRIQYQIVFVPSVAMVIAVNHLIFRVNLETSETSVSSATQCCETGLN